MNSPPLRRGCSGHRVHRSAHRSLGARKCHPLPLRLPRWIFGSTLLTGLAALLWLLFRSGTKPSRLSYPCQQAAFSTASMAFGPALVAAVVAFRGGIFAFLRTTPGRVAGGLAAIGTACTVMIYTVMIAMAAVGQPNEDGGQVVAPIVKGADDYRAEVFLVNNAVNNAGGLDSGHHGGVDDLIELMGTHGLRFFRSATEDLTAGPDGLIDAEGVVLIKINAQWPQRGGTNCDVLTGVIRRVVEHPDGFSGEILVADNGQGSGNLNPSQANAEDRQHSSVDVVADFAAEGWRISAMLWDTLRYTGVSEFSDGDMQSGYVVSGIRDPETRIRFSYPKFQTSFGTYVSYKYGVWSPESESYDSAKLAVINLPVLKTHFIYGVTASVKNHMGVVSRELGTDSHNAVGRGGMGTVLAEVRMPSLNLLDCTWVLARPGSGPDAPYAEATRRDQLAASLDPVALDMWATESILIPQIIDNGYSSASYRSTQDPENPNSVFRRYLDQSMNELLAAGIETTNDMNAINLYTWSGGSVPFVRGDANSDEAVDVSDAITILDYKFIGEATILCEDAADANDDGQTDMTDAIFILRHLFLGDPQPPPPFPNPGLDATPDSLDCGTLGE